MRTTKSTFILAACSFMIISAAAFRSPAPQSGPEYTANGDLKFPEHYREWIYLTSGFAVVTLIAFVVSLLRTPRRMNNVV